MNTRKNAQDMYVIMSYNTTKIAEAMDKVNRPMIILGKQNSCTSTIIYNALRFRVVSRHHYYVKNFTLPADMNMNCNAYIFASHANNEKIAYFVSADAINNAIKLGEFKCYPTFTGSYYLISNEWIASHSYHVMRF